MINIINATPQCVVGAEVFGKLTKSDYEKLRKEIKKQDAGCDTRLYIDIVHLEGVTPKAMMEDLKMTLNKYSDFKKIAIHGAKEWQSSLIKIGDILTPGLDIKYFEYDEKEAALQWVA